MNYPKLTQKQKDLAPRLSRYDIRIMNAYIGAIYTIQQEEYPDRLAHFAYSLRDVIDLLARSKQSKKEQSRPLDRKKRKPLLQYAIDPLGEQVYVYNDKYEILLDKLEELNSIAHKRKIIPDEKAEIILSVIEDILYTLTVPQTAINEEIDEIVLKKPSVEDARKLVNTQFRVASQLKLVKELPYDWLPCMIEVGFFNDPPPIVFADGSPKYVNWAPSQYLTKCVNAFPKKVTDIILSCTFKKSQERNPVVYVDFLTCGLNLPIDCVEKIGQKMLNERWHDFIEKHWFVEKYVEIMEKLYINKKYDMAIKLAHRVFTPKLQTRSIPEPDLSDGLINKKNVTAPFDSYWFEETLRDRIPRMVQKNPVAIIELIATLLCEYIKLFNQVENQDSRHDDGSDFWRAAIEKSAHNWQSDPRSILVTSLSDCLLYVGNSDVRKLKDVMSTMYQKDYWVYHKLALFVYAQFPHVFEREIIMSVLWYFDNKYTYHEYYNLIKTTFSTLPIHVKQRIFELIDSGFNPERFEKIKNDHGASQAKLWEKEWKRDHLEAIVDDLDETHSKMYSELVEELDVPEHPGYLFPHPTVRIGQPAIEPEIFEGKDVSQIFGIVKNHTSSKELFGFDDKIVATFEEYVRNNPLECSKKSSELKFSDDIIQYVLFSGLRSAVEKNKDAVEWEGVLPLIEHIVSSVARSENHMSKSYDPLQRIYSLMEDGFKKDSIGFQLKNRVWNVVTLLVEIGTHNIEPEGYPDNKTDSLTISINNVIGMSFHVVYQYAVWCEKHSKKKRILVPEAKQVFDDYLDQKLGCHTASRHAVLGVFFPNFYYLDQEWVKNILGKIRSGKNEWIAFWDGYVSWNTLYTYVFADLHMWYDQFLNKDLIRNLELEQPYDSTINHTMLAYFYDLDNADGFVEKFFDTADKLSSKTDEDKLLIGHCVHQIGIIMKGKDNDSKFNKQKLIKMWKRPSVLQHDLNRWFEDSPLDKQTTISLYLHYVKNYPKEFDLSYTSIEVLGSYLNDCPQEVADCLEILVGKPAYNHVPVEEIRNILKSLLGIGNEQINTKCVTVINHVALLGYDWRDLL